MPLDKDSLVTELRTRLGDPSESALPPEQLDYAVEEALREYSRYVPMGSFHVFDLLTGVSTYDLPEGVEHVDDLWVRTGTVAGDAYGDFFAFMASLSYGLPQSGYEMLSEQNFTPSRELGWSLIVTAGSPPVLSISPEPLVDYKAVAELSSPRGWSNVGEEARAHLLRYAMAVSLEYIGLRRSKSIVQIPTATGSLKLANGHVEREEARRLRSEFRRLLGAGATTVAGG